jgi:hypothetical protein
MQPTKYLLVGASPRPFFGIRVCVCVCVDAVRRREGFDFQTLQGILVDLRQSVNRSLLSPVRIAVCAI